MHAYTQINAFLYKTVTSHIPETSRENVQLNRTQRLQFHNYRAIINIFMLIT